MAPALTFWDYAERIEKQWQKAATSIIEVARLCSEANERLSGLHKKLLIKELPFGESTFSKLVQVGNDKRLRGSRVRALLPPSYSTIYEITLLNDKELNQAIKDEVISPTVRRAAVQRWRLSRPARTATVKSDKPKLPDEFYAGIYLAGDLSAEQTQRLDDILNQICAKLPVEIVRLSDQKYEKAMRQWTRALAKHERRVLARARREARRWVRKREKEKLGQRNMRLPKAKRLKLWGFTEEEVAIEGNFDWEQIERVFKNLGDEDRFRKLKADAYKAIPEPDQPLYIQQLPDIPQIIDQESQRVTLQVGKRDLKAKDFQGFK
jgi:hypothetical protein